MNDTPRKSAELTGSFVEAMPLLVPDLTALYTRRYERLIEHAGQASDHPHPLRDYLLLAAEIVDAQRRVARDFPLPETLRTPITAVVDWRLPPLDISTLTSDADYSAYWQEALNQILEMLIKSNIAKTHPTAQSVATMLRHLNQPARSVAASQLLSGDAQNCGVDAAPFYWAALSLTASLLSRRFQLEVYEEAGVARYQCPICGGDPVASLVQAAPPEGVRYLHCGLCEHEWRVSRAQCTNCEASGKIQYWSLDNDAPYIKAESCGDCESYLKVVYQNVDPKVEVVADDLASLALDYLMEEQGFAKSATNPFLFHAP